MTNLGNNLFKARKDSGLSINEVAKTLDVSIETILSWESNEFIPDIYQSKKLASLYNKSLDELFDFNIDIQDIEHIIKSNNDEISDKIDWTNTWGDKYPILSKYQNEVNIPNYAYKIRGMLNEIKEDYGYTDLDAMLVLKDILYHEWKRLK